MPPAIEEPTTDPQLTTRRCPEEMSSSEGGLPASHRAAGLLGKKIEPVRVACPHSNSTKNEVVINQLALCASESVNYWIQPTNGYSRVSFLFAFPSWPTCFMRVGICQAWTKRSMNMGFGILGQAANRNSIGVRSLFVLPSVQVAS